MATVGQTHPCEFIREELDAREWTPERLAEAAGVTIERAQSIIDGDIDTAGSVAVEVARAFGTSAELWEKLNAAWYASFDATLHLCWAEHYGTMTRKESK